MENSRKVQEAEEKKISPEDAVRDDGYYSSWLIRSIDGQVLLSDEEQGQDRTLSIVAEPNSSPPSLSSARNSER